MKCEFCSGSGRVAGTAIPCRACAPYLPREAYSDASSTDSPSPLEAEVSALKAENSALKEALEEIGNHEHCVYPEHLTNNDRQYDIGVTDGHRCAASIARRALSGGTK